MIKNKKDYADGYRNGFQDACNLMINFARDQQTTIEQLYKLFGEYDLIKGDKHG